MGRDGRLVRVALVPGGGDAAQLGGREAGATVPAAPWCAIVAFAGAGWHQWGDGVGSVLLWGGWEKVKGRNEK